MTNNITAAVPVQPPTPAFILATESRLIRERLERIQGTPKGEAFKRAAFERMATIQGYMEAIQIVAGQIMERKGT